MQGKQYQELAMRTNDNASSKRLTDKLESLEAIEISIGGVFNACLGLSGEVGEVNDMIKKWIFHEHTLDEMELKKEVGDIMWYIALICDSFGWTLDEVMELNIEKLKKRYPDGFSSEKSVNRKE